MDVVPDYAHWDRLWQFWRMHEGLLPAAYVDPEWPEQHHSKSMMNEMVRQLLPAYIEEQLTAPALREQVVPPYPPPANRAVPYDGPLAAAPQPAHASGGPEK